MLHSVYEITSSPARFDSLPLHIALRTSKFSFLMMAVLFIAAGAAVIIPLTTLIQQGFQNPELLTHIIAKPQAATQVLLGLILWVVLILVPLRRLLSRLGRRQEINIADGKVVVTDHDLCRVRRWTQDLVSYQGIAHDVRTTHAGTRHELILLHTDKRYSLLLHTADAIEQNVIDRACDLLQQPQLSARSLYFSLGRQQRRVKQALFSLRLRQLSISQSL